MVVRRSRIWRCCATRWTCSERWPRIRLPGGCCPMWTVMRSPGCGRSVRRHGRWRGRRRVRPATGETIPGLVLDLDASIVICHSEKESATRTWKKTLGYHPLFCFLDNTREALSGLLREGRAGSNTTADHITVLDRALEQIPDAHRYGTEILVRSDSAGCTHGFLAHIRGLRELGINTRFSVGVAITEPIREAIRQATEWIPGAGC